MIKSCRRYITCNNLETIWSQPRAEVVEKLRACLDLHAEYRRAYRQAQEHLAANNHAPFNFSAHYVFGKFDAFCRRLQLIMELFGLVDKYKKFLGSGVDGEFERI